MSLRTQTDAFYITLELFSDGLSHTRKEIFNKAVGAISLSDEETKERTKSGTPIYESRLGWGISYLERAGMLKKLRRGVYEITPRGEQALQDGIDGKEFLCKLNVFIDEENPWKIGADTKKESLMLFRVILAMTRGLQKKP